MNNLDRPIKITELSMKWTPEHEQAFQRWCKNLHPPNVALESIRNKMRRLKMSPEEIDCDWKTKIEKQKLL